MTIKDCEHLTCPYVHIPILETFPDRELEENHVKTTVYVVRGLKPVEVPSWKYFWPLLRLHIAKDDSYLHFVVEWNKTWIPTLETSELFHQNTVRFLTETEHSKVLRGKRHVSNYPSLFSCYLCQHGGRPAAARRESSCG